MWQRSIGCAAFAALLLASPAWAIRAFTPEAWQPRLVDTDLDTDGDFVHDAIESEPGVQSVWVFGNKCLEPYLTEFADFGTVEYNSQSITAVALDGITSAEAAAIVALVDSTTMEPYVAFVRLRQEYAPQLRISARGIKALTSSVYPAAQTARGAYPGTRGAGVNIAFLDTGIDDGVHGDLPTARFVAGYNATTGVEENPVDATGHGTLMAAVAAGNKGIADQAGIIDILAYNPLSPPIFTDIFMLRALDWCRVRQASANDIHVLCIGLGPRFFGLNSDGSNDPISVATQVLADVGILVVAGTGNLGMIGLTGPAAADGAIAVGALADAGTVDRVDDTIANYSNRGPRRNDLDADSDDEMKPEVVAPGGRWVDLCGADIGCLDLGDPTCGIVAARFATGADSCQISGTSVAAAHVAGVAALVAQHLPGSPSSVRQAIIGSAEDKGPAGWDAATGWGEVDAFAALESILMGRSDIHWFPIAVNVPTWENPALGLGDSLSAAPIGVETPIRCTIVNAGPSAVAEGVEIHVWVFKHGLDSVFPPKAAPLYKAGSVMCGPLPIGEPMTFTVMWTPRPPHKKGAHACLFAEIVWPKELDASDNRAQRNVAIGGAASPADFPLEIYNPTTQTQTINVTYEVVVGSGWTPTATPSNFVLPPNACGLDVLLSLNPGPQASNRYRVRWRFLGNGNELLGGTTTEGYRVTTGVGGSERVMSEVLERGPGVFGPDKTLVVDWNFDGGACNPAGWIAADNDSGGLGSWGRLYSHATDNDICDEATTCSWIWSDNTTPTVFTHPSMSFGPSGFVVRNWLDNTITSPWVTLPQTSARGTHVAFRIFPGNFYLGSRVLLNWSVRSKIGSTPGAWARTEQWVTCDEFAWVDVESDVSAFVDPAATEIQVRFRVADAQRANVAGAPPPTAVTIGAGPGPYLDSVRIGRCVLTDPMLSTGIDMRSQGQDCFPTEIDPGIPSSAGEHFRPTQDRFGTAAFSASTDLVTNGSPKLIIGDSVSIQVQDVAGAGGITSVLWYGAIVEGPHAGKAPAPHAVGGNGFFAVTADSSRTPEGIAIAGKFFVDLDDTYFRGGDQLEYFWAATDNASGFSSDPSGLTSVPSSVNAARAETDGLHEVSFLPSIQWDPGYLSRIAADATGDLDPTAPELAASVQANCILYVNQDNLSRRSTNRTSFMFTLDRLGYAGHYDVYDHRGAGNINNHLGGRATVDQAEGYRLIVYDTGDRLPGGTILPDGTEFDTQKVDQAGWFRNWLSQVSASEVGFGTLWIIGSNALEERAGHPLYATDMGVLLTGANQGVDVNPDCVGLGSFTFDQGPGSSTVNFNAMTYRLDGGCPNLRSYDGIDATGTAVRVFRYRSPSSILGPGAIVMNRNNAENWNTILQSHPWSDMRGVAGPPTSPTEEEKLLAAVLGGVLPASCLETPTPTDTPETAPTAAIPLRTLVHQATPNPFNPATVIRFDLARDGHVLMRIYDVLGRAVCTLVDTEMKAGANHSVVWKGTSDAGTLAASGLYFCRFETEGYRRNLRLVLLR